MSGDLEEMSEGTTSSPLNESAGPLVCDNKEMNYFIHSSFAASVRTVVLVIELPYPTSSCVLVPRNYCEYVTVHV